MKNLLVFQRANLHTNPVSNLHASLLLLPLVYHQYSLLRLQAVNLRIIRAPNHPVILVSNLLVLLRTSHQLNRASNPPSNLVINRQFNRHLRLQRYQQHNLRHYQALNPRVLQVNNLLIYLQTNRRLVQAISHHFNQLRFHQSSPRLSQLDAEVRSLHINLAIILLHSQVASPLPILPCILLSSRLTRRVLSLLQPQAANQQLCHLFPHPGNRVLDLQHDLPSSRLFSPHPNRPDCLPRHRRDN